VFSYALCSTKQYGSVLIVPDHPFFLARWGFRDFSHPRMFVELFWSSLFPFIAQWVFRGFLSFRAGISYDVFLE
jgi:hypothetical protein